MVRQVSMGDVVRSPQKKKLYFVPKSPEADTDATKRTNSKEPSEDKPLQTISAFKISPRQPGCYSPRGSALRLEALLPASLRLMRKQPAAFRMPEDFLRRNGIYRLTEADAARREQRSLERRLEEDLDGFTLSPFAR